MLKALISPDQFAGLADEIKKLYGPAKDGKHILQVEAVDGFNLEDITGLKNAHAATKAELKEAKASAEKAIAEAKANAELMAKNTPEEWQKKIDKIAADHKAALDAEAAKVAQAEAGLGSLHLDSAISAALASQTLVKGGADLLKPHLLSQVKAIKDESGKIQIKVVGPDGKPQLSKAKGSTSDMSVSELLENMRAQETFAPVFAKVMPSGTAGSTRQIPQNQANAQPQRVDTTAMLASAFSAQQKR